MPSYETLDSIADAYTPLLALLSLTDMPLLKARWRLAGRRLVALSLTLLAAYGLRFLDGRLHLWSTVGLALVAFL